MNKNNTATKYSHKKKKRLAEKISLIKDKKTLATIFGYIYEDNKDVTENNNSIFMYFHKLTDETYAKIDKEIKKNNKRKKKSNDSTSSDNYSEKKEFKPYSHDEFPSQKNFSPKLKLSNREKNLIKRKIYDYDINIDSTNDVVYQQFGTDSTDSIDRSNS